MVLMGVLIRSSNFGRCRVSEARCSEVPLYPVIASVVFVIQRHEIIFYACYCTPLLLSFTGSHEMHVLCYIHSNVVTWRGLMQN